MDSVTESVLVAIRKIIHASDLHSRQTKRLTGRTSPQLLLLKAIKDNPGASVGLLANKISLSQATTTTILDRLVNDGLATRERSSEDRRKVLVNITEQGLETLSSAPLPLQSQFVDQFEQLRTHERTALLASLQHVAELMLAPVKEEPQEIQRLMMEESL